jgi:hypothetical protein
MRKEEALGYQEITRRAREAVAKLSAALVYAGFSLDCFRPQPVPSCLGLYLASLLFPSPPREALLDPTEHALYRV